MKKIVVFLKKWNILIPVFVITIVTSCIQSESFEKNVFNYDSDYGYDAKVLISKNNYKTLTIY